MRLYLRFASWRWIPPAGAGGGYRLPTLTQLFDSTFWKDCFTVSAAVCQLEETSSYAFYLLGSAVCQREETRHYY